MVGSHKVNINLNPQTISTFLDTVVIENKFKSKPKFLRSSQQLKLTVNWSKILQEEGFLRSDLKINHPALFNEDKPDGRNKRQSEEANWRSKGKDDPNVGREGSCEIFLHRD